jgi:hypothetical protein
MTLAKDNYIDPNDKARWGFAGSEGNITVGPQTVGETGGVDHARVVPDDSGAHNTGGGISVDSGQVSGADTTSDSANIDGLTVAQLKEQLDAKGVAYKSTDTKADLVAALKAANGPTEAAAADGSTDTDAETNQQAAE